MHRLLLLLILPALLLAGCGKSPKSIADLKEGNAADSMMYFFGEMQAHNYWTDAQSDTILRSEEARKAFMEGFRTAIGLDEDDAAYNKGLQLGLRLGVRLREFESRYGIEFPEDVLADALENSLRNDSSFKIAEAQKGFYLIKDRLELAAATKEIEKSKKNLAKEGKKMGFKMLNDTLYALDITQGTPGPKFRGEDKVAVEVIASTLDGQEIVTRQFPDSVVVGEGRFPEIVRQAILTMNNGQTRKFMTTARTLFGKRYAVYKLPYDQPVMFTVKAERKAP